MYDVIDVLEEFGIKVPRAKDGRSAKKTKSDKKGSKSVKADPQKGTKTGRTKNSSKLEESDIGAAKEPKKEGKRRRRLRIHPVLA
jgi:hypothetical protein